MNYDVVTLGDVCEFLDSQRVPITESDRKTGPYPYYGANGQQDSIDSYIFDEPLVLLAEDGGYFGSKDRPIAYKVTGKCWVNNHAHVLRPKSNIDVDYLHRVLSYYDVSKYVNGTTRQKLTKGNAENISFPLPPLTEQKRIASLLARADRLRSLRRTARELGESLLQSVFLEMFGDVVRNERGWEKVAVSDLGNVQTGNTPSREESENFGDFIEWIKSDNIRDDQLYISQSREMLSEIGLTKGRSVDAGAVLITCIAGSLDYIGDTAITNRKVAFNQQINAITPFDDVNSFFLKSMLHVAKPYIQYNASDGMKHIITKSKLEELVLVKPPLSQQEEFAGVVARVEGLRGRMSESERQAEGLFESLLAESFA